MLEDAALPSLLTRIFGHARAAASWLQQTLAKRQRAELAAAVIVIGLCTYFWMTEGTLSNITFTVGVTAALIAVVTIATRRVFFSAALVAGIVAVIAWSSAVKRKTMDMVVHAYDLFFYLSSWSTISYLWNDHRGIVLTFASSLVLTALIAHFAWRYDTTRVSLRRSAAVFVVAFVAAVFGAANKGERRHMQFYFENLYVSSFYASWAETLVTLWQGTMIEAQAKLLYNQPNFIIPTDCITTEKPPHIVLVHQELIVPPAIFPTLQYDKSVDSMFKSDDGKLHGLRVETFGGASWLSEFSILAGVSSQAFGGMRQFVQTFTVNRLKDTLPQNLERCGYRNVVFYPMLKNFVSNQKFYNSIGMNEIFDLKDQKAPTAQERDRFYFANALDEMQRHVATSKKPIFTYIQTMSGHWPYDWKFAPEMDVPGGGPGLHHEMNEYLRRISIAKLDFDYLMAEIKRRLPGERVLIVHYGDHHPTATRTLLGQHEDLTEPEDVVMAPESLGYQTYFAMRGHNYRVPELPQQDVVDIPYLGTLIQNAARLPLSGANKYRLELLNLCQGRYYSCSNREAILGFHRRLIDSGIILAR